jgi:hypothetical protein
MRRAALIAFVALVGCAEGSEGPTPIPASADSRAALLAGVYALTITLDERCSQIAIPKWIYRATLADAGGYLNVNVVGGGYAESTGVGQMYTFPDFTTRFVWNFDEPDADRPDPRTSGARLLLYGASDTKIVNGTIAGTILGTASTDLDFNARCYGSHPFRLISTGE